jgi:hypothetical protein
VRGTPTARTPQYKRGRANEAGGSYHRWKIKDWGDRHVSQFFEGARLTVWENLSMALPDCNGFVNDVRATGCSAPKLLFNTSIRLITFLADGAAGDNHLRQFSALLL